MKKKTTVKEESVTNRPFEFVTFIKNNVDLKGDELKNFNPVLINKLYYFSGKEVESNFMNFYWDIPIDLKYKIYRKLYSGVRNVNWIKNTKKKKKNTKV